MEDITSVTPLVCELMGIEQSLATNNNLSRNVATQCRVLENKCEKMLVFCPDAIGSFLYDKYPEAFAQVCKIAPVRIELHSVYPSFTPVCFASMFTGLQPQEHGIKRYEKPVVRHETLFDSLYRQNKKVAIVAVQGSSIDTIFRERPIDYYSEKYDAEVIERTSQLLLEDRHDFILAYNQEYDDNVHKAHPESEVAMKAFNQNLANFVQLGNTFNYAWEKYRRGILFAPDHGAHFDTEKQTGAHGSDMPEDMNINHFFGFYQAESRS